VLVPAGIHSVEMRYEPASFRYGIAVSLGAQALVAAVAALSYVPSLRGGRGGRFASPAS
jgi:hypothetical protein